MGQRLNFEIESVEGIKLNVYYHWSGYTRDALNILKDYSKLDGKILSIFQKLQEEGARLTPKEFEYVVNNDILGLDFDLIKQDCIDRNNGLISFSEEGMEETKFWQECGVTLSFYSNRVSLFKAFLEIKDIETILEYHNKVKEIEKLYCVVKDCEELCNKLLELEDDDYFIYSGEMKGFIH